MEFETEKAAKRRIWFSIFVFIVLVESGWWIAGEIFLESEVVVYSDEAEEISPDSFFCRISD